ncbi:MAG: shikimate dehydrogenase [Peptococcaceae bacterium]|nr:shikimate dehydrogenase [Peptococcaceae bacterium]
MINADTRLVGLLGTPVRYSLSPVMQNAAFHELGLNYAYVAFDVGRADLAVAVGGIKALGLAGANVTVPHKEAVFALVDEVSRSAYLTGAVNTIVNQGGKLVGYNTDGEGFIASLKEHNFDPTGKQAVVIGAGGASRAVCTALGLNGMKRIVLVNRSTERAGKIAAILNEIGMNTAVYHWDALVCRDDKLRGEFANAALVVQTTPLGMHPREDELVPVPPEWCSAEHLVYDLVYNPPETALLRMARQAGARTANGLGMLVHQGAEAFKLWTGKDAPLDVMRAVVNGYFNSKVTCRKNFVPREGMK